MKQPLHRKKLQLALQALGSEEDNVQGQLDHSWVTSEFTAGDGTGLRETSVKP